MSCLISSRRLAHRFIARGEHNDADERVDERPVGVHAPAFEYDAEVCGVPGEEHVHAAFHAGHVHVPAAAMIHVIVAAVGHAVVHVGVVHGGGFGSK